VTPEGKSVCAKDSVVGTESRTRTWYPRLAKIRSSANFVSLLVGFTQGAQEGIPATWYSAPQSYGPDGFSGVASEGIIGGAHPPLEPRKNMSNNQKMDSDGWKSLISDFAIRGVILAAVAGALDDCQSNKETQRRPVSCLIGFGGATLILVYILVLGTKWYLMRQERANRLNDDFRELPVTEEETVPIRPVEKEDESSDEYLEKLQKMKYQYLQQYEKANKEMIAFKAAPYPLDEQQGEKIDYARDLDAAQVHGKTLRIGDRAANTRWSHYITFRLTNKSDNPYEGGQGNVSNSNEVYLVKRIVEDKVGKVFLLLNCIALKCNGPRSIWLDLSSVGEFLD